LLLGLWDDEVSASITFGAGIVAGALVGAPCHGLVAERLNEGSATRGGFGEATRLLVLIGVTSCIGVLVSALMNYALASHNVALADGLIPLVGAMLLGSLGLQVRLPLLLVPSASLHPLAIFCATLAGYAGEFSGPLLSGSLKDRLAPLCAVLEGGAVDPRCASSAADQRGLLLVVVSFQSMTLLSGLVWFAAAVPASQRAAASKREGPAELL